MTMKKYIIILLFLISSCVVKQDVEYRETWQIVFEVYYPFTKTVDARFRATNPTYRIVQEDEFYVLYVETSSETIYKILSQMPIKVLTFKRLQ